MAIELIIGFTLLVIPDVVIRALIAADGGTTSTIVGRVLGALLSVLGSLAHQPGVIRLLTVLSQRLRSEVAY